MSAFSVGFLMRNGRFGSFDVYVASTVDMLPDRLDSDSVVLALLNRSLPFPFPLPLPFPRPMSTFTDVSPDTMTAGVTDETASDGGVGGGGWEPEERDDNTDGLRIN